MQFWGRSLLSVILVCFLALVSWPLLGGTGALWVLCWLVALLLAHHLRNLSHLYRWIQNPAVDRVPDGSGIWEDVFSYVLRMVKRQKHSESRLSAALHRFQLAGAALPEAVVLLDAADRIEWCNPRAESYFGIELARDCGQQVTYI
ncbi:MAG: phosphate regulon sensor protein PhoR, partial [Burkholderiales bacterium]